MRRRKTLPKNAGWYWFDDSVVGPTKWRPIRVYRQAFWGLVVEIKPKRSDWRSIGSYDPRNFGSMIKK